MDTSHLLYIVLQTLQEDCVETQSRSLITMAELEHPTKIWTDAPDQTRSDRGSATIIAPAVLSPFLNSSLPLLLWVKDHILSVTNVEYMLYNALK